MKVREDAQREWNTCFCSINVSPRINKRVRFLENETLNSVASTDVILYFGEQNAFKGIHSFFGGGALVTILCFWLPDSLKWKQHTFIGNKLPKAERTESVWQNHRNTEIIPNKLDGCRFFKITHQRGKALKLEVIKGYFLSF